MKALTSFAVVLATIVLTCGAVGAQGRSDDLRALREQLERRYEIVPVTDGVALRPKARGDVRLIDVTAGAILINGTVVTGRELRDRLGSDADAVLRLSYLPADRLREFAAPPATPPSPPPAPAPAPEPPLERAAEPPRPPEEPPQRARRTSGDRIRVFGDVNVREDEEIDGQVVAVFGSVRVDGAVGDQVVAVLGSVNLGPRAVVDGDIVSVGGRVRRSPGAQTRRGVTEVSLSDSNFPFHVQPWFDGWDDGPPFFRFGALPRLIGTGVRLFLLLLLTGVALAIARRSVEASAERVSGNPLKTTVVGLVAEVLVLPVLILIAIVLSISIIGIPLLLLLPFVVLALIVMALVGFTGTAAAIGNAVQRRFAPGATTPYAAVVVGVLVILSPVILGRVVAMVGWPLSPAAMLLVGIGFMLELLAWASGFGAILTHAFSGWQARRVLRP